LVSALSALKLLSRFIQAHERAYPFERKDEPSITNRWSAHQDVSSGVEWGQSAKEASESDGHAQPNPRIRPSLHPNGNWQRERKRHFLFRPRDLTDIRTRGHPGSRRLEIFVSCAGSVAFACLLTWGKVPAELISFSHR